MHRYLRSVGFSTYKHKKKIEGLLTLLEQTAENRKCVQFEPGVNLCEIRAEVAPGMGVTLIGEVDEAGCFQRDYYYPYLLSPDESSAAECSIQRHTEKETFAGLLDDNRVGISLIFYLENGFEFQKRIMHRRPTRPVSVRLSSFSNEGKILLPLHKTRRQIEMAKVAAMDRNNLLEAARNGDEEAMETLTIEDIDMYSQISRRVMREDLYSIVDSCFMPSGIECDQYSVIGDILHVEEYQNKITDESIYNLTVSCNDLLFHVGILKADLMGDPQPGRRFKGQIWMQGTVVFSENEEDCI